MGKSTLAARLKEILPEANAIKLGTHAAREDNPVLFRPRGTPLAEVLGIVGEPKFLIVESGAILDDPELEAAMVIFLPAPDGRENKPGSERRREKADIVRGEPLKKERANELCARLEIEMNVFAGIADAAGVPIAD